MIIECLFVLIAGSKWEINVVEKMNRADGTVTFQKPTKGKLSCKHTYADML